MKDGARPEDQTRDLNTSWTAHPTDLINEESKADNVFMPPTSKKMTGHIGFRLSVRWSRTVDARVLKFRIWIPHGKIFDARFFFLVRLISLSGVMPL